MKWRVALTVCFVILLFAGFAYLYVNNFVRKHQHAVILIVVDGLDLNLLNETRQQAGRAPLAHEPDDPLIGDARRQIAYRSSVLNLDSLWDTALLSLQQPGQPVPDEGADTTALACGQRVDNGFVAINNRSEPLPVAHLRGGAGQSRHRPRHHQLARCARAGRVLFPQPGCARAGPQRHRSRLLRHRCDPRRRGIGVYRRTVVNENGRRDGRNLVEEAKGRGYTVLRSRDDLQKASYWRLRPLLGLFAPDGFYFALAPAERAPPAFARGDDADGDRESQSQYQRLLPGGGGRHGGARGGTQFGPPGDERSGRSGTRRFNRPLITPDPTPLVIVTNNYSLGALVPTRP